jgi:branched-chain amino acid transport system ATP-binding protein
MSEKPFLQVRDLSKAFGAVRAVQSLSFALGEGELVALIGPNGSGKTTVVNLITGFLKPDTGTILHTGKELSGRQPYEIARLGIVRTFQMLRLFPQITVLENMLLARRTQGEKLLPSLLLSRRVRRTESALHSVAEEHLERVGLLETRLALAGTLSHGQRKLLELARCLATRARCLLLDEPVAGVFPSTRNRIIDILKEEANRGRAILFIEHDLRLIRGAAERVIVLDHGEKIGEGPPEQVLREADVVTAYLGGDAGE